VPAAVPAAEPVAFVDEGSEVPTGGIGTIDNYLT
jgi:hypothetical protein